MAATPPVLDYYTKPVTMCLAGSHAVALRHLPDDIPALARIVQGLLLHQHLGQAYGVTLSPQRQEQSHIRSVAAMLDAITALDPASLEKSRPLDKRLIGVCRHFTLLLVAILRLKGIPARARCGFGAYFQPRKFLDHWVAEYWNEAQQRWTLVDAQIDDTQRALFKTGIDTMDVPRDRFLVAGDAWHLCRKGRADAQAFGILDMHGQWFIASNVLRDLAALNNREMLPWDVWGAMVRTDKELDLKLIDRLATLTSAPDAHFAELREVYGKEARLHVPAIVLNAVRDRPEAAL